MEDRANYSVGAPIDRTAGFHSGAVDVNLEELFRKLRRRIWLILAIIAAATLLTAAVSLLLPTRYTATAKVMVADRSPTGPDLTAAAQGMPPDLAFMTSQVQVIASRNLAATVIDKLGLESDPEFNQELRPKTLLRQLLDWLPIESVRRDLGLEPPVAEGDSPLPPS